MRRCFAAAAAFVMIFLLFRSPAAAEGGRLYTVFVPPADRGTIFYLDIYSDDALSAAMLELRYDDALAEYRSVTASATTTSVKAKATGGVVAIVLGDSAGAGGCLCRLTFKALASGTVSFILRMTEGVDAALNRITPPPADTLSVTLSVGSVTAYTPSGGSYGGSYSGSKSTKSGTPSDYGATSDELPVMRDISHDNTASVAIIAAACGAGAVLLVILGFFIGRKAWQKKKPAEDDGGEEETDQIEE